MRWRRRMRSVTTTPSLKVGFFGILCSGNLGNDGSLEAVVRALKRWRPDAQLGFLCTGPAEAIARYGAPATAMQWYERHAGSVTGPAAIALIMVGKLLDLFRTLAWVRRYDVVVVPGMGILESTAPLRPWATPYSLFVLCVAARAFGTKVALVSVGANVSRQRMIRWLHTTAARMAHYRSYRDGMSYTAMRRMGIDVAADAVYPDLVFALDAPPVSSRSTGYVGVGLMEFRGDNSERSRADELHRTYVATMKQFVGWLAANGHKVRLFAGDRQDETVLFEVKQYIDALALPSVLVEPTSTLDDLMRQMATVDIVVGTRYHNVLCALRLAKPTLSVGYATKHHELMAGMGLGEFSLDARHTDFGMLVERFTELNRRSSELQARMVEHNRAYTAQLDDQFVRLFASVFDTHRHPTDIDRLQDP